ncbi:MAG TPA: hypothetical protein VHB48_08955 [Chitinophagaceae bacterium]|nr:hypothetical protein [Chitinophagaceae bacterium]
MRNVILFALFLLAACKQASPEEMQLLSKIHKDLTGVWIVTHAEVIEVPEKFLNNPTLKQCEVMASQYEYKFGNNNQFARYVPGRADSITQMHGYYNVDSAKKQIDWYCQFGPSYPIDTVRFNYVTVNPYKIVMIEGNGVYNILTILKRKAR